MTDVICGALIFLLILFMILVVVATGCLVYILIQIIRDAW